MNEAENVRRYREWLSRPSAPLIDFKASKCSDFDDIADIRRRSLQQKTSEEDFDDEDDTLETGESNEI